MRQKESEDLKILDKIRNLIMENTCPAIIEAKAVAKGRYCKY